MEQLAEHVGLKSKEFKGKTKLAMSGTIHAWVEKELQESNGKVEYFGGMLNFFWEMPPPL